MKRKLVIAIAAGFMAVALIASLYFFIQKPEKITPAVLPEVEKKAIVFKDVKYAGERKGVVDWEIRATLARKFMDKPVVEMESVKGLYRPRPGVTVSFQGSKSSLNTEKETGYIENVVITYNKEYSLKSKYMDFDFKGGTTSTNAYVEIRGPKITLLGTGLTGNSKEEVLVIRSNVSGTVETAKGPLRFQSDKFTYRVKEDVYMLEGRVFMRGEQFNVQCADLYLYGRNNELEKMVAKGKVRMTSKRMTVRGENAVYYFKDEKVVSRPDGAR
jgi:LPS export ABC transporter protein LptC